MFLWNCGKIDASDLIADDGDREQPPIKILNPTPAPIPSPFEKVAKVPKFNPKWGLSEKLYIKATKYFLVNSNMIANRNFLTIVNFSMKDTEKRMFIINLITGTVERRLVSNAAKSDPNKDGYPTEFSNVPGTEKSSLGFYLTLDTYISQKHGRSLRLRGLSASNFNAESRAIVFHPAQYVNEAKNYAGHSWGCLAVDPKYAQRMIDKIKTGGLILVDLE